MDKSKWTYKKLGDICQSDLGKTLNHSTDTGELYPYLCAINILWDKVDLSTLKETRFESSEIERYTVNKGDLLICEGGDAGRAAIWSNDEPILYQNALHRVRFNKLANARFYLYFLRYLKDSGVIDSRYSKGVTIKHLVKSSLLSIPVPVPTLDTQQSIVSELDKINELISLKKAQLSDLDSLAQSIFYDMFGDPIENEKGWEVKKLGEVTTFINGDRGKNYPSQDDFVDKGVPFINAGHIKASKIDFVSMNFITEDKYKTLNSGKIMDGDILFCLRGSLGKRAIVKGIAQGAIASSLVIIRCNDVNNQYLFHYLGSSFISSCIYKSNNGSSQPNLSATSVSRYIIPLPPLSLQQDFAKRIELIEQQKAQISSTIKDLETLLASRMQYWFD